MSRFCSLDMSELKIIYESTVDKTIAPRITGILDKRTNKLYSTEISTLLHLGATQMLLFDEDYRGRLLDHKIFVLGLPAPALLVHLKQKSHYVLAKDRHFENDIFENLN
jgi:hypothetical protein